MELVLVYQLGEAESNFCIMCSQEGEVNLMLGLDGLTRLSMTDKGTDIVSPETNWMV